MEDSRALGELLELYRGYLALLARLHVGRLQGKVDASDVVQDTFLEAYRHFPQFQGTTEAELVGWILAGRLAKLLRHYLGTRRRDMRLERELQDELDQSSQMLDQGLLSPGSSTSQQAARREQAVLLAEALRRLPADYREVLILRHLEGLPFPDLARRMDRTLDSVKNLWTRALARLRDVLGEEP
jgi:RNA polymerase sigma-70 factor (ECF subfamily)